MGGLSGSIEAAVQASVEVSGSIEAKGSASINASAQIGGSSGGQRAFDHQGSFRFQVDLEFDGVKAGAFRSVEGIAASVELIEYQGGGDLHARQIPGRPKVAPVVLKKGYVNTSILWDWMKATMEGKIQLQNVTVVLLADDGHSELARYDLLETWPSSWKGWQLDANSSNAMVEEIELQVRQVQRVNG
jgi:phage tail-like protein